MRKLSEIDSFLYLTIRFRYCQAKTIQNRKFFLRTVPKGITIAPVDYCRRGEFSISEVKEYLQGQFDSAREIGADKSLSVGEATGQVLGMIREEFAIATNYTAARKERKKAVADRLQQVRKARGMKQQDAAEKTGINVVTLSGYEIGKNEPNMEALVRLADAYGVSLDYLLCRTDTEQQA